MAETSDSPVVTVRNLPGVVLATIQPVPATVALLKEEIEKSIGMSRTVQKLIKFGEAEAYADSDSLEPASLDVVLIKDADCQRLEDESAMYTWDIESNPGKESLEGDGGDLKCPNLRRDYCNVITKEPMRSGVHFYQFVMHYIGDEQACGIVDDPSQVGYQHSLRSLMAWAYYPGRVRHGEAGGAYGTIRDGKGALHAQGKAVKEFKSLRQSGDVIGMLVDMEQGAVAFDLNGELQGACAIPTEKPLYVITHVDTSRDHVELRKPNIDYSPPENLDALKNSLLDITQGIKLR